MSLKSDIVQLLQEYKDATEGLFSRLQPTFLASSSTPVSASVRPRAPPMTTSARATTGIDRYEGIYECLLHISDCESRVRLKLEDLRRHQAAQVQIQSLSRMNEQLSLIMEGVLEDMLDMKDKAYGSLDTVHSISRPVGISLEDLLEYSAQLTLTTAPPSHWRSDADVLTAFRYAAPEISVEMQNSILWKQGELVGVSEERADVTMDMEQQEQGISVSEEETEEGASDEHPAPQNTGGADIRPEEGESDDDPDLGFDEGDDDF
jgi:hypothetical protein